MTDTGHSFTFNTYEGGNGGAFFSKEVMNGAVKSITYARASSDISRISSEGLSIKLAKQSFVNGYSLPPQPIFISPPSMRTCTIIVTPSPPRKAGISFPLPFISQSTKPSLIIWQSLFLCPKSIKFTASIYNTQIEIDNNRTNIGTNFPLSFFPPCVFTSFMKTGFVLTNLGSE